MERAGEERQRQPPETHRIEKERSGGDQETVFVMCYHSPLSSACDRCMADDRHGHDNNRNFLSISPRMLNGKGREEREHWKRTQAGSYWASNVTYVPRK